MFNVGDIVKFAPGVAKELGRFDTMRAEVFAVNQGYVEVYYLHSRMIGFIPEYVLMLYDSHHQHTLKTYIGFTETYEYCTECGKKERR